MKNQKIWITMAVLLTICIGVLWAAENKTDAPQYTYLVIDQKDTLKGLQGVRVLVEGLKPEIENRGLTRQQLQTDVELRLRQNGIKVLTEKEWLSAPGGPLLYVNVNIMIHKETLLVAFHTLLQLKQAVFLARDLTKKVYGASTWERSLVGSVGLSKIESIREKVKDQVDTFSNDYLTVNPK